MEKISFRIYKILKPKNLYDFRGSEMSAFLKSGNLIFSSSKKIQEEFSGSRNSENFLVLKSEDL